MVLQGSSLGQTLLELAKLYWDRCDCLLAIEKANQAADIFLQEKKYDLYLECQNLLMRQYAETKQTTKIIEAKEYLQDLALRENLKLNSKFYYTMGLCSYYKDQLDLSREYLNRALQLAAENQNQVDVCFATNGLAIVALANNDFEQTSRELQVLDMLVAELKLPEIENSIMNLRGFLFRKQGKYNEALSVLWQAYEKIKDTKKLFQVINLHYAIGRVYLDMGENDLAKIYLTLARRSLDSKNLVVMSELIEEELSKITESDFANFDIVLNERANLLREKNLGQIDLKNQFIIVDLLKIFLMHPGQVFSKEKITSLLWKEVYNPAIHDNKIYVTIKRLRNLLEPDPNGTRYIYRDKNGYYLDKNIKIHIEKNNDIQGNERNSL